MMITIIESHPIAVLATGVFVFIGLLLWVYFHNRNTDDTNTSSTSTNRDKTGRRSRIKTILFLSGGFLFLLIAKPPSFEIGPISTQLLTVLKVTVVILAVTGLGVLGYKLFPTTALTKKKEEQKEEKKSNTLRYTIFGVAALLTLLFVIYLVPWSSLFPTGELVSKKTPIGGIGNLKVLKALAPFVFAVLFGFLTYYGSNDKKNKNLGYAITVTVFAMVGIAIILYPEAISVFVKPFLNADPINTVIENMGTLNANYLLVITGVFIFGCFMTGHAFMGLFALIAFIVYFSEVYCIV